MYNGSTILLWVTIFVVHKQCLIWDHCSIVILTAPPWDLSRKAPLTLCVLKSLQMQNTLQLRKTTHTPFIYQMIHCIRKHSVFAYPKREGYYISRLCFEIARQFRLSTELYWSCDLACNFTTEPIETVMFSFGISENPVFKCYWHCILW
jgi:hypothetical protein